GEMGAATIDADAIVEALYAPGRPGARVVEELFGTAFLDSRKGVDREKLAAKVFNDGSARRELEAAVHPLVLGEIRAWLPAEETKRGALAGGAAAPVFGGG